jgi:3-oxoacyl-(acyl-carrier-protein) synthase
MSGTAVFVRSGGAVSPAGVGLQPLSERLADPGWSPALGLERPDAPPLPVATCRDFVARDYLPPLVARRLDRPARLLAVAAREALAALGDDLEWARERIGVCAGTWNAGTEALVQVLTQVFMTGPADAPPMQFPSTVANAPASQLGILERLAGPNLTFAEKQVGGLRALAEAARLLRRKRADAVLACGVDEAQWLNAESYQRLGVLGCGEGRGMLLGEGAAVLLLAREPGAAPLARLAGWGSAASPAAPHRYPDRADALLAACDQALRMAELSPSEVDLLVSMGNGLPALDALEETAVSTLFGTRRPMALAPARRLGEGAFAGTLRALIAALAVAGLIRVGWEAPPHLAAVGCRPLRDRPATALVAGLAGGGSAIAVVLRQV